MGDKNISTSPEATSKTLQAKQETSGLLLADLGPNKKAKSPSNLQPHVLLNDDLDHASTEYVAKPIVDVALQSEDAQTINRRNYKNAEFSIEAPQSNGWKRYGSGSFFSEKGDFLTALHVAGDAHKFTITMADGTTCTAVIDDTDRRHDLAGGHILETNRRYPYLVFERPNPLTAYRGSAFACGFSHNDGGFTIADGTFRKISPLKAASALPMNIEAGEDPSRPVIVDDMFIPESMSGGVLFNNSFMPLGILTKGTKSEKDPTPITISTPVEDYLNFIKKLNAKHRLPHD